MKITTLWVGALALALIGCGDKDGDSGAAGDATSEDGGDGGDGGDEAQPYGPDNSWFHVMDDVIPGDLEGSGRSNGDIANNFTMIDQFGDDVELYQFYSQVIVIDVFAEW